MDGGVTSSDIPHQYWYWVLGGIGEGRKSARIQVSLWNKMTICQIDHSSVHQYSGPLVRIGRIKVGNDSGER